MILVLKRNCFPLSFEGAPKYRALIITCCNSNNYNVPTRVNCIGLILTELKLQIAYKSMFVMKVSCYLNKSMIVVLLL